MAQNNNNKSSTRRRKKDDPDVKISKALSWVLRHGAPELGLEIHPDGFIAVDHLLAHSHPKLKNMKFESIKHVVETNAKQRFSMKQRAEDGLWYIRANQGHSISSIDPYQLLTKIDPSDYDTIIHGTYLKTYKEHIQQMGLSKMGRTHIHFAKGMNVVSGMRGNCNLFIHIDGQLCAKDGIEFFESANGVILTDGVDGILSPKYFQKVEERNGTILLDRQG